LRRSHAAAFKEQEGFSLNVPALHRTRGGGGAEVVSEPQRIGRGQRTESSTALSTWASRWISTLTAWSFRWFITPTAYALRSIARKVRDLATRAREKKLGVDDFAGGTFTITNPGPFGTLLTGAVINQPQVAILSTDGVSRKPVVVTTPDGGESIAIHSIGLLALTFDHRAVDGAYAARYLRHVAEILNSRDWSREF